MLLKSKKNELWLGLTRTFSDCWVWSSKLKSPLVFFKFIICDSNYCLEFTFVIFSRFAIHVSLNRPSLCKVGIDFDLLSKVLVLFGVRSSKSVNDFLISLFESIILVTGLISVLIFKSFCCR